MNEITGRKTEGLSLANFTLYLYILCVILRSDGFLYKERAERSFQGFGVVIRDILTHRKCRRLKKKKKKKVKGVKLRERNCLMQNLLDSSYAGCRILRPFFFLVFDIRCKNVA